MDDLAQLLVRFRANHAHEAVWGDSHLYVSDHLTPKLPPDRLITSVRAVVLVSNRVVVLRDPDDTIHLLPGGRREPGESLVETLRREVLEETGWEVGAPVLLGFRHFRHATPRPLGYQYPYPSFLQVIYGAMGLGHRPEAVQADAWLRGTDLVALPETITLPLGDGDRLYLRAACTAFGSSPG